MIRLLVLIVVLLVLALLYTKRRHDFTNVFRVYEWGRKIRLGADSDGGYVIADLGPIYDCYISAGVSNEESFSRDFINKYNMNEKNSFAFDGTIEKYPTEFTKKITFHRKNINSFSDHANTDLSFLLDKFKSIFLKMDIEGGEYPWFSSLNKKHLKKFKQITIEVHEVSEDKLLFFEKLNKTHYLIHVHGNNYGSTDKSWCPSVLELTYISKDLVPSPPRFNRSALPSPLDFPNKPDTQDINLNFHPFVH